VARILRLWVLWCAGLITLSLLLRGGLPASAAAQEPKSAQKRSPHLPLQTAVSATAHETAVFRNTSAEVQYVGSEACKTCHMPEYQTYRQTPHGEAATLPDGRAELKSLPPEGETICLGEGERCLRVFPGKDGYFMSQFDRGADGSETHVEVEKVAFALGKPLMATGYLIQRGSYLFEAPLTFYAVPNPQHMIGWALSPGYDNDALGFTRPVVDSCLTCHIGRPRPTNAASNLYKSPPFEELSIGCESCHGPGSLHVKERAARIPQTGNDTSIVNPKNLTNQRADETCMYCHELGQARVPQPGKSFQDYRPGVPLLQTEAIFKSKLLLGWNLEEWSDEMATSACYRLSNRAMRCSTCHDPHSTPTAQEAPAFYRSKCLTCHQSSSCTLPLSQRQHTQPADNCITCHMPKHAAPKLVKVGGRGTSHRITRMEDEPVPLGDTPGTSIDLTTGIILVDSDSADAQRQLNPVVLLKGYQGILAHDRTDDLERRYTLLLQELSSDKYDATVFSAIANADLAKHTDEGNRLAVSELSEAIRLHSDSPKDYMLLSELQYRANDLNAAIAVLTSALARFPYLPTPYENLAVCYLRSGQASKAGEVIERGLTIFPSDKNLLALAQRTHSKAGEPPHP
jgi:hypothetical protein